MVLEKVSEKLGLRARVIGFRVYRHRLFVVSVHCCVALYQDFRKFEEKSKWKAV